MKDRILIKPTQDEVEQAIKILLLWVGEDPTREGLLETPTRVARAYHDFFCGYQQSAERILGTVFEDMAGYDDPIFIRDIAFFSHCEHHMVPIVGKAHIAYLPDRKIIGLSKIPRIVEVFARRLQTQETLTTQIANVLDTYLQPKGAAVLIEAEHLCMAMRGVQKQGVYTITTAFRGLFKNDKQLRNSFIKMQGLSR